MRRVLHEVLRQHQYPSGNYRNCVVAGDLTSNKEGQDYQKQAADRGRKLGGKIVNPKGSWKRLPSNRTSEGNRSAARRLPGASTNPTRDHLPAFVCEDRVIVAAESAASEGSKTTVGTKVPYNDQMENELEKRL
jgi:hypothetical protein